MIRRLYGCLWHLLLFTGRGLRRLFSTSPIPAFTLDSANRHGVPRRMTIYNIREGESASRCLSLFCIYCFLLSVLCPVFEPAQLDRKELIPLDCVSLL